MELKFKVDTKHRKQWFTGVSFSHPAKMSLPLQLWIIENYTRPGDTLLDPMAGSGTILVACSLGRNAIAVELEAKFIELMKGNWGRIKQRGPQLGCQMGECQIIQGDARNLGNVLVDHAIFSPPYADARSARLDTETVKLKQGWEGKGGSRFFDARQGDNPSNISNLPYGDIDSIITSPPYAEAQEGAGIAKHGYQGNKHSPTDLVGKRSYMPENTGNTEGQISRLPYGSIDAVISSPPYEQSATGEDRAPFWEKLSEDPTSARFGRKSHPHTAQGYQVDAVITSPPYEGFCEGGVDKSGDRLRAKIEQGLLPKEASRALTSGSMVVNPRYGQSQDNIGNLKGESYLSAMLEVYMGCHRVLRPQGLMILVTKNFIRNKKEIRLDEDTMKLCDQAGFQFVERHYRKLPAQSFWRVIYRQKYPEAPVLDKEDILVFVRKQP